MFLSVREEVEAALADALAALDLPADDLGIEQPPDDIDAVLASSAAFRLAGEAGAPPPQVAAEIADSFDADDCQYIDRVDTQGPYLNFWPSEQYFAGALEAGQAEDYGALDDNDTSVVVEHTSANPT